MVSYKNTIVKTVIWRIIATSITIFTGWYVSGDWRFGLTVGGIDTVLKTIGYFSYERIWQKHNKFEQ
jgi:uncharacterized membrane protein|tara:strand:- start:1729 stop:1929 length:201 start_codon:yes stop_codon:yes gene_type:complete